MRALVTHLPTSLLALVCLVACAAASDDDGICRFECPDPLVGSCTSAPVLGTGTSCNVGDALPGRLLTDCCGRLVSLVDVVCRAKATVIELGAGWCAECRAMAPSFNRWRAEHSGTDLALLQILRDTEGAGVPATADFCSCWGHDLGLSFPVLIDPSDQLTSACASGALPTTLVVDATGRIVAKITGEATGAIEAAYTELLQAP